MRILWLNWRDIANPDAGGAEVFTHQIMSRLAKRGHEMTLFSAVFPGGLKQEDMEGVHVLREGGKIEVYRKAAIHYKENANKYDLVIDEINTKPFMTPRFVKDKPIIAIIHQLAREFWFYETAFPLNYIGYYFLEKRWLSYYKDIPTITVSNSSKSDLEDLGFKNILMVPEGLNVTPLVHVSKKESTPTIMFVGRLKKAKLPHHALEAFTLIKKEIPDAKMWIIGDGYMLDQLKRRRIKDVTFFGHVKNEFKYELMSRAHLTLVPAVREGWGLVVTESNAMGTPTVAYDVHGLRDSVKNESTGILVKSTPLNLANATISLLKNRRKLAELSDNALADSKHFTWDKATDVFEDIIRRRA